MKSTLPVTSAFVSYSTKDKIVGRTVKRILEGYGIASFLAHEDLAVSEEWKERILEELRRCDVFVALLSRAFRDSDWGSQELGFIVGRKNVAIIPLSIDGTVPFGFISHLQGKRIPEDGISDDLLIGPLARRHPHKVIPGMIRKVVSAGSYRGGEAALRPLVALYPQLDDMELDALVSAAIANSQVWSAGQCRGEYLPQLIEMHRDRIDPKKLRALEYQVEHDRPYK